MAASADGSRKGRAWSTWLAYSSAVKALMAIGAGWAVKALALPALARESSGLEGREAEIAAWLVSMGRWLPLAGVPALVLSIAAIMSKRFRLTFGILATLAFIGALVVILGVLLGALLPLYQAPSDLMG